MLNNFRVYDYILIAFLPVLYFIVAIKLQLYGTQDSLHVLDTVKTLVQDGVWNSNREAFPDDYSSHPIYVVTIAALYKLSIEPIVGSHILSAIAIASLYILYRIKLPVYYVIPLIIVPGPFFLAFQAYAVLPYMALIGWIFYVLIYHPTNYRVFYLLVLAAQLFRIDAVLIVGLPIVYNLRMSRIECKDFWEHFKSGTIYFGIPYLIYLGIRQFYFGDALGDDRGYTTLLGDYEVRQWPMVLIHAASTAPILLIRKLRFMWLLAILPLFVLMMITPVWEHTSTRYLGPVFAGAIVLLGLVPKYQLRWMAPAMIALFLVASVVTKMTFWPYIPELREHRIAHQEFAESMDEIPAPKIADLERGWIYASEEWPTGWTLVADNPKLVRDLDIALVWCNPNFDCDERYEHINHWTTRWELTSICGPIFRWYVNPANPRHDELGDWLDRNYPDLWRVYTPEMSRGLDAHFAGRKAWWNACKY